MPSDGDAKMAISNTIDLRSSWKSGHSVVPVLQVHAAARKCGLHKVFIAFSEVD